MTPADSTPHRTEGTDTAPEVEVSEAELENISGGTWATIAFPACQG
jgi:hypothetical protein